MVINMDKQEIELIYKINPDIFGKGIVGAELRNCSKCKKLMEYHNGKWFCNCIKQETNRPSR